MPFCFHKCHYCDFYSLAESGDQRHALFMESLIAELAHRLAVVSPHIRTIFCGGGTPTLLAAGLWRRLLDRLGQLGVMREVVEFTVEANPETVTDELLGVLASGGVNRISIGAQSFDPRVLKTLERWHEPENVGRAVAMARRAGIHNINLDLIFATPGQTMAMLDDDLDQALALQPTHLSCYALTFEPATALTRRKELGLIRPTDEGLERAMYEHIIDRLDREGFDRYEVSNWARRVETADSAATVPMDGEGLRCRHNMVYWRNENWLGVGPSAASHIGGHRWKNEAHLGRYLEHAPEPMTIDYEFLPEDRRIGERIMLGLRLTDGLDEAWLDEVIAADQTRKSEVGRLCDAGLLERSGGRVRLTRQGLLIADSVIAELL